MMTTFQRVQRWRAASGHQQFELLGGCPKDNYNVFGEGPMSGYLHFRDLEDDLYVLLSIVTGNSENESLLNDPSVAPYLPHAVWFESTIESLLISLAVRMRMVEDRFYARGETVAYPYKPHEVCRFVQGQPTASDARKSGLRLSCDKIVHAGKVSFYTDRNFDTLRIEGTARVTVWQVSIDMRKFAVAGLCLATQYENNWMVSARGVEHGSSPEPGEGYLSDPWKPPERRHE